MNPAGALHELTQLLPNCLRQDRLRLTGHLTRALRESSSSPPESRIAHWLAEAKRSVGLRHQRHERLPQVSYPSNLPISSRKEEIVAAIRAHQVVVIAGETGSGKTTQIPKMCLEAGCGVEGKIGCTQPRRVAALSISRRIASELGVTWGEEVGCKIRFTDKSSPATYIKLMTDGILLAETQGDRDLDEYDAIVIDEAHERSLNIDFLLGHLTLLRQRRSDLKIVITSATIDTEAFSKAFDNAPILEVSGRTYPVEVRYRPHDLAAEEDGEMTYIDAAVAATEDVLLESDRGDVLIFMPSERDIRETQDDLQGRYGGEAEIIPLFGRLSAGEQDRVFAPSVRRKIIVATNIAETSLTIPGVRYVVDPGLARVSRYSPRTRTKRLPIEPVSQSSARQRAGRSGRVENGVCIRLYTEEDFANRPRDTQPEIQRANLAEVILKMKAWRLGEMETFPFVNPPQPQAVQSGYQLLQELGALDSERALTPLGRDLARLPVDPSIGRMILQSIREGALSEVLVIAAGLSIQDPRERPMDRQEAADLAHRRFINPASDFLTLLNIWNAYDAQFEALKKQGQMRKFCKANFLSYLRMREWVDVHAQLEDAVQSLRELESSGRHRSDSPPQSVALSQMSAQAVKPAEVPAGASERRPTARPQTALSHPRFAAIHRSVLAGLLGHVAQRIERNLYRASGNRQLMLWPGSGLFARNVNMGKSKGSGVPGGASGAGASGQPAWVVAGEIVETSRLYGRTVAEVTADWIADLGVHVCKRSYGEPFWDRQTGRVLSRERVTLFGLEVLERAVDYGRIHPRHATDLFIRAALIEEELDSPHHFLEANRKLRQRIEVWRTQHRNHRLPSVDDALFEFYARHLENVSSVHDLNRFVRERIKGAPDFLCAKELELTGGIAIRWDTEAFPTEVTLSEQRAALDYAYAPGEDHDGVTVKVPASLAVRLDPKVLDWVVPGLRAEQIEFLLKALPKSLRVPLMPIAPKVQELATLVASDAGLDGLRGLVREKYGVSIPEDAWSPDTLPQHLRPRIEITGPNNKVLAVGRNLKDLKQGLATHQTPGEQLAWNRAVEQWERYDLQGWSFGDPPARLVVSEVAGAILAAFPGLEQEGSAVHLKLFRDPLKAAAATRLGFTRLAELALRKELAWVEKDLGALDKLRDLLVGFTNSESLITSASVHIRGYLILLPPDLLPLRQSQFEATVQRARGLIPGLVPKLMDLVTPILRLRADIIRHRGYPAAVVALRPGVVTDLKQLGAPQKPAPSKGLNFLRAELDWLLPANFLAVIAFERLPHWPRYLKALLVRADRALLNPGKDAEKAKLVQPYLDALRQFSGAESLPIAARSALGDFRILVEEFKVSVFAQELGTAQPVSAKRLDAQLHALRQAM